MRSRNPEATASGFFVWRPAERSRREWPLVEAAVVPTALLALAWAGVWSRETGAALALGSAILQITGWGVAAGFRSGASPLSAVILGVGQGLLGVLLLVLERLIQLITAAAAHSHKACDDRSPGPFPDWRACR